MLGNFLLEIGMEELPARFMANTLEQLKNNFAKFLEDNRLSAEKIDAYGTPRRLVLYAENIPVKQEDIHEEVQGPAYNVAFDQNGNPSKAGLGFAKGKNIDINDIIVKETEKGKYIFAPVTIKGKYTKEIIEESLNTFISNLNFPKNMVWNDTKKAFPRPVRWLLGFFDKALLNFEFAGIKSNDFTFGHRLRGKNKKLVVNSINEYFRSLLSNHVMLNQNDRKNFIFEKANELAKSVKGKLIFDEDLLEEVTNLVEYPALILGTIEEKFLELPQELLITSMSEHLKFISISNEDDKLLPYYIVISNGDPNHSDNILSGNQKVLNARLNDAKFFYDEDTRKNFEQYREKLKDVVFQVKLGTVEEKLQRISKLSEYISDKLLLDREDKAKVLRAAYLCKNDLVTLMLGEKEFTKLQGLIGSYYAKKAGENDEVAQGIFEHYLPRYAGDKLPETASGKIVSISDKMDTIIGIFGINMIPSGSQDPFALRRAANGILKIIFEKEMDINLHDYIKFAINLLKEKLVLTDVETQKFVFDFFKQRIAAYFRDEMNYPYDVVNSIMHSDNFLTDLYVLKEKAKIIADYKSKDEFINLITGYKRVANITKNVETVKGFDTNKFKQDEEKALYEAYRLCEENIRHLIQKNNFDAALTEFLKLREPIDKYFDNVMVMDKDPELKENKLGMLTHIRTLFLHFADFSEIVFD